MVPAGAAAPGPRLGQGGVIDLPVRGSGRASSRAIAEGIMYSGRSPRRKSRRAASAASVSGHPGWAAGFPVDDVGNQRVVARDDHAVPDARVAGQPGLHLARLDPQPAQLDLPVVAPKVDEAPLGVPAAQVTGPVEPPAVGPGDGTNRSMVMAGVPGSRVPRRRRRCRSRATTPAGSIAAEAVVERRYARCRALRG